MILRQSMVGLICLGLVIFWRLPTFTQSVINWDESIYILMADSMTRGYVPYTAVWEVKPVGLYTLFALAQEGFGHSIVTFRLLTCLSIAISCFLLYLWGSQSHQQIGLLAALFYAFFSLKNDGLAANAEIFFSPLVIGAFYLAWGGITPTPYKFFFIGLLMGLALQIKPITLFDFAALLTLLALSGLHAKPSPGLIYSSLLGLGLILPFIVVWGYFSYMGHWADYYYANVTATLKRSQLSSLDLEWALRVCLNQLKTNFVLDLAFVWTLATRPKLLANFHRLALWGGFALLGVAFTRSFYPHYFLQLLPPLCLLAAALIYHLVQSPKSCFHFMLILTLAQPIFDPLALTPLALVIRLSLPVLLLGLYQFRHRWPIAYRPLIAWGLLILLSLGQPMLEPTQASLNTLTTPTVPDTSQQIAIYIQPRLQPNQTVYVVNYQPIIYYLLNILPPTRYAFPPFLTTPEFSHLAGVDPLAELPRIMAQHPQYVIMLPPEQPTPFYQHVMHEIHQNYHLEVIINQVKLYRRTP